MQKRQKRENKSFLTRLLSLVVVVLLIATAAVVRDGKLFGHEWSKPQASQAAAADGNDTLIDHVVEFREHKAAQILVQAVFVEHVVVLPGQVACPVALISCKLSAKPSILRVSGNISTAPLK